MIDSRYARGPITPADEIAENCGTSKLLVAGETTAPGADALADGAIHALARRAVMNTVERAGRLLDLFTCDRSEWGVTRVEPSSSGLRTMPNGQRQSGS